MKKDNFFSDNAHILFLLEKRMNWEALFQWLLPEQKEAVSAHSGEEYFNSWKDVLNLFGELCGSEIAPNARKVEEEEVVLTKDGDVVFGPTLTANINKLIELGTPGMGVSPKYGGLGAPFVFELIATEMLYRACPSTLLNSCWWSSIAHVIDSFGSDRERDLCISKLASGEWSGNMALTEPDAGSDLGGLRTYGELQGDGSWRLYGSKRFISNGNGQVSLVLGKNKKGAEGLKALNLYVCLHEIDGKKNYQVTKLEHKVGLKGSATCELKFDGSKAFLVGGDGEGFKCMLKLMNDARIAVGLQGVGLMESVLRSTLDYAEQRKSWGKPIAQHELIAEKILDMQVETAALRSLCYQAAFYHSMAMAGEKHLKSAPNLTPEAKADIKSRIQRYHRRVRRWTPLIKYWMGERTFQHARTGVQILGGYGFTTEYRAEWHVRESLILSIYEGTSQIQAMMCTKDTLKDAIKKPRKFIELALGIRMQSLAESDPLKKKVNKARQLFNGAVISILFQLLKENVRASFSDIKPTELMRIIKRLTTKDLIKFESMGPALMHSERLCEMKSLVALCEITMRDAKVDPSYTWIAERMINKSLPRLAQLKSEIDLVEPVLNERLARFAMEAGSGAAL